MSDSEEEAADEAAEAKKPGLVGKLIVWGAIFAIGAGTGAATPMLLAPATAEEDDSAAAFQGIELMDFPEPDEDQGYIDFKEVVVNLNDPQYSRFLSCSFSMQVAKSQVDAITLHVEENHIILKNWLIAHIRDKKLEEVRGKFGHNLLRREIHSKFNELLFTDGVDRIQDILFKEFKVQ